MTKAFSTAKNLHDVKASLRSLGEWRGASLNVVLADNSGNIGYTLTSSSPIRKHEYPHMGSRVLDGTTSYYDWVKLVPIQFLPFVMNPKKGYYATANQRIVPENSRFDIGASLTNTARALRIDEVLSGGIKQGKKFNT